MEQSIKNLLIRLNKDIFAISAVSFAIFVLLEWIKPKFVIGYLNINYILLICLVSGILAVLNDEPAEEKSAFASADTKVMTDEKAAADKKNVKRVSSGLLVILSLIVFAVIAVLLRGLGWWGVIVAVAGALVSFLLGGILIDGE